MDFSSSDGLIVRCCVFNCPADLEEDVVVPDASASGIGRVVTMCVTDLEKNFSSRYGDFVSKLSRQTS